MDLQMDAAEATEYKNPSQAARRVTEKWATNNLYCIACTSGQVESEKPNTPVLDYTCPSCGITYQLKSKNGRHGPQVSNSAYEPKMVAIKAGVAPNYAFLEYSRTTWSITGLFIVPGHFMSPSVIQRRNPLGPNARRAGWVGSNIPLGQLPSSARVPVVENGAARCASDVREDWQRYAFLKADRRAQGGWGADTLSCVGELQKETGASEFDLQTFYSRFEQQFGLWHPDNHHVEAKIRQQLQVLRNGGILQFIGRGQYRILT